MYTITQNSQALFHLLASVETVETHSDILALIYFQMGCDLKRSLKSVFLEMVDYAGMEDDLHVPKDVHMGMALCDTRLGKA